MYFVLYSYIADGKNDFKPVNDSEALSDRKGKF